MRVCPLTKGGNEQNKQTICEHVSLNTHGETKKRNETYTHYYYILNFLIVSSYGFCRFLSLLKRVKHIIKKKVYECRIVNFVGMRTTQCINGHNQQQIQQSQSQTTNDDDINKSKLFSSIQSTILRYSVLSLGFHSIWVRIFVRMK